MHAQNYHKPKTEKKPPKKRSFITVNDLRNLDNLIVQKQNTVCFYFSMGKT